MEAERRKVEPRLWRFVKDTPSSSEKARDADFALKQHSFRLLPPEAKVGAIEQAYSVLESVSRQ